MQKTGKFRYFILGVFVTLFLSTSVVQGFAATVTKQLNAVYRDIKIVIDGSQITPKDASGNTVEPFVVDGTTYLPVRAVGEAFGKEVAWDGDTNTVYIGETSIANTESTDLTELNVYDSRICSTSTKKVRDMSDSWYELAKVLESWESSEAFEDYLVNGEYTKIEGVFFAQFGSGARLVGSNLKIWGDGKLLYDAGGLRQGLTSIPFSVDISGVKLLTIGWEMPAGEWNHDEGIGVSAKLY